MLTFDDLLRCIEWTRSRLHDNEDIPEIASPDVDLFVHGLIDWSELAEDVGPTTLLDWSLRAISAKHRDTATRLAVLALHWQLVYGGAKPLKDDEGHPAFKSNLDELLNLVCPSDYHDWRTIRWEIMNAFYAQNSSRMEALFARALDINCEPAERLYRFRAICLYLILFGHKIAEWLVRGLNLTRDISSLPLSFWELLDFISKEADASGRSLGQTLLQTRIWEPDTLGHYNILDTNPSSQTYAFHPDVLKRNSLGEEILFRWSVSPIRGKAQVGDTASCGQVSDIARDLEDALRRNPDCGAVCRCVLSDCLVRLAKFREAAHEYTLALGRIGGFISSERKPLLYEAIADCQYLAGDHEQAVQTLEHYASEYPSEKARITIRIAQLLGERSPEDAHKYLRDAGQNDALAEAGFPIDLVLRVGGALDIANEHEERRLAAVLASRPDTFRPIAAIARDWWPWFSRLTRDAQNQWVYALYQKYFASWDESQGAGVLQYASIGFAKAVESELRDRVFRPLREKVRKQSAPLPNRADIPTTPDVREPFAKFMAGDNRLSLGQMGTAIRRCLSSGEYNDRKLREFLMARFPSLTRSVSVDSIRSISEIRGEAAHECIDASKGERLFRDCREVLKAVHSGMSAR